MPLILCLLSVVSAMLMDMPPTDPYEAPCFGVVSMIYDFGCDQSDQSCLCADERFVSTVVNCIDRISQNITDGSATNSSLTSLGGKCYNLTSDQVALYASNSSTLPNYPIKHENLGEPGTWPVTQAFALSDAEVHDAYMANQKNDKGEDFNKRYGAGLVAFWAGVVLLSTLSYFSSRLFPTLWMRVHKTKLFCKRRSLCIRTLGDMTVMQFLTICTFVILTIVFSFIQLSVSYPDYTANYSDSAAFGRVVGMRTGVLSLYLLPLLILFAGRNNFLLWLTDWSQDTFVLFHRWIARVEVALVLAHAIAYSISRAGRGKYGSMWVEKYWNTGIVGLAFGMFMFVQGMRFIRRRAYDLFIFLHIISAILFLAMGYWHLKLLEENIGLYFFYASFAVWGADRVARLIRVLRSGFYSTPNKKRFSFGVPTMIELEHNTLAITFDRPHSWKILSEPGKFVYIHFLIGRLAWQSHPFTLVSSSDPGKVKLFARIHNGITKRLADLVLERGTLTKEPKLDEICNVLETKVLLDGPYGHSHDLFEFDELVFVAGGTGITAPFSYIQNSLATFKHGFQKITLFWAVSTSLEKWFDKELQFLADFKNVEVHLFYTRDPNSQKFNVAESVGKRLAQIDGPRAVLCCGPDGMSKATRDTVADSISQTTHFVQYYEESFSL